MIGDSLFRFDLLFHQYGIRLFFVYFLIESLRLLEYVHIFLLTSCKYHLTLKKSRLKSAPVNRLSLIRTDNPGPHFVFERVDIRQNYRMRCFRKK